MRHSARNSKTGNRLIFLLLFTVHCSLFTVLIGCSSPKDKQPTAKIGASAPAFELVLSDGSKITLDNYKGKPLVITFMASWCPCSNESAPVFKEVYNKYNPMGVEFLMLGIQDSQSKFRKFLDKQKFPFHAGFDSGDDIAELYGINAPPTTVFITKEGKIARAFYGKIDQVEKLSNWVEDLLAQEGRT